MKKNESNFDLQELIQNLEDKLTDFKQKLDEQDWKKIFIALLILIGLCIGIKYIASLIFSQLEYNKVKSEAIETVNACKPENIAPSTLQEIVQETSTENKNHDFNEVIASNSTISELHSVNSVDDLPQETLFQENETEQNQTVETSEATTITEATTIQETLSYEDLPAVSLSQYIDWTPSLGVDHATMKAQNQDYRCWLNIPGTTISYPVPKGPDNQFYLHKTFASKTDQKAGSLFIDAQCTKGLNQDNLVIYGHNMGNGTMFGTLKKFKNAKWFTEHPYIELYSEEDTRVYLIFAVRVVKSNINTLDYELENFRAQQYIDNAASESIRFRKIDLTANGFENSEYRQIITLSTCSTDDERLLVSGLRIK